VAPDASVADVATAWLALAERCAPWRFTGPHEAVAEKATEVFLALSRAYAELADGDARQRLRERRQQARAAPVRPRADVYAIKTDHLDADGQFRAGLALKEAGRYTQALPLLEYAADLDAQNATYRAELAHCRFLDAPEVQGRRALEALAEAIRLDPRCAVAHLYSGAIHLAAGDVVKARAALAEAARLAPADPRVRTALQQLGPV
jgi:tetratricopeptide (TPR) repeat protein